MKKKKNYILGAKLQLGLTEEFSSSEALAFEKKKYIKGEGGRGGDTGLVCVFFCVCCCCCCCVLFRGDGGNTFLGCLIGVEIYIIYINIYKLIYTSYIYIYTGFLHIKEGLV